MSASASRPPAGTGPSSGHRASPTSWTSASQPTRIGSSPPSGSTLAPARGRRSEYRRLFRTGLPQRLVPGDRSPVSWRWSHAPSPRCRHRRPRRRIAWRRPVKLTSKALTCVGLINACASIRGVARSALGTPLPDGMVYLPQSEWPKAVFAARAHVASTPSRRSCRWGCFWRARAWRARSLDGDRPAAHLRLLAHGAHRHAPAPRTGRGRARPPAQQAHRLHGPGPALDLMEHERPPGAPHVAHGAPPRAVAASRGHQARPAAPQPVHVGGLGWGLPSCAKGASPAAIRGASAALRTSEEVSACERAGAFVVHDAGRASEVATEISKRVGLLLWSVGAGRGRDARYLFADDMTCSPTTCWATRTGTPPAI